MKCHADVAVLDAMVADPTAGETPGAVERTSRELHSLLECALFKPA